MRFTRPEIGVTKNISSGFYGEMCPVCGTRLGANLKYPICNRCQRKYYITVDLLKELTIHRFLIASEEISWEQKPHPEIEGTLDEYILWKASFVMGGWLVEIRSKEVENCVILAQLIKQYLDSVTPAWLERAKTNRTRIRRYFFMVAAGASIVTAAYLRKRLQEMRKKEKEEAEGVEKEP